MGGNPVIPVIEGTFSMTYLVLHDGSAWKILSEGRYARGYASREEALKVAESLAGAEGVAVLEAEMPKLSSGTCVTARTIAAARGA